MEVPFDMAICRIASCHNQEEEEEDIWKFRYMKAYRWFKMPLYSFCLYREILF